MTPEQLSDLIVASLAELSAGGAITLSAGVPEAVTVERPRQKGHGDYATNVALQLGKQAGMAPRDFAGLVAERLASADGIAGVEVAGPGFLNITVDAGAQGAVADDIVAAGPAYGGSEEGGKQKVNVEFVSANPTGPVTLASARWAAVGDTLARLLEASGYQVSREYYFNDHGAQIDRFSRSLLAAGRNEPTPEDGYPGEYIAEVAAAVVKDHPEAPALPDDEALEAFRAVRRGHDVRGDQGDPRRLPGAVRHLLPRERPLRLGGHRPRDRPAPRARQHLRAGRRALAAHREVRRRQGPRDRQVRRRPVPTSPPTRRTTSTSASAASTGA